MTLRRRAFVIAVVLTSGCGGPGAIPSVSSSATTQPGGPQPAGPLLVPGFEMFKELPSPLSAANAEQILIRTEGFAFGGMPYLRQVEAYNVIFDQPDNL